MLLSVRLYRRTPILFVADKGYQDLYNDRHNGVSGAAVDPEQLSRAEIDTVCDGCLCGSERIIAQHRTAAALAENVLAVDKVVQKRGYHPCRSEGQKLCRPPGKAILNGGKNGGLYDLLHDKTADGAGDVFEEPFEYQRIYAHRIAHRAEMRGTVILDIYRIDSMLGHRDFFILDGDKHICFVFVTVP